MRQQPSGGKFLFQVVAHLICELVLDAGSEIHILRAGGGLGYADARLWQLSSHISAAVHDALLRNQLLHDLLVAKAVLERDDDRLRPHAAHSTLESQLGYRCLDHDDDDIANADFFRRICRIKAGDVEFPVRIPKNHAVLCNFIHMCLVRVDQPNFLGSALPEI